jgi:hypothetical protein
MGKSNKKVTTALASQTPTPTIGGNMLLYYDSLGNFYQIVSDTGQILLSGTTTTGGSTMTLESLPQNQSLIADIATTAGQRDQNGSGKYWVNGGVLTQRQGWHTLGFPPVPDPNYQSVDVVVHYYHTRTLTDLLTTLKALTTQQKTNIWTDLASGTPPRYANYSGGNDAGIFILDWVISDSGLSGNALTVARLRITAMYVQDHSNYLVNPAFDTSISVPGIIQV